MVGATYENSLCDLWTFALGGYRFLHTPIESLFPCFPALYQNQPSIRADPYKALAGGILGGVIFTQGKNQFSIASR